MVGARGIVLRLLLAVSFATSLPGCDDEHTPPDRLLDGSRATAPGVELAGVHGPVIATKVDVVSSRTVKSCLGSLDGQTGGPVVRRVGVDGISITFRTASSRGVYACESSAGSSAGEGWCGRAYGRLHDGRLSDTRLDLTCLTEGGDPVAFAWIEPAAGARFAAVRQPGFVEVYEVAGDVPVRVATTAGVVWEESAAMLHVSEHDRRGAVLRTYSLYARVAG